MLTEQVRDTKQIAFIGPHYKSVIKIVKQQAFILEILVVPDPEFLNLKYFLETSKTLLLVSIKEGHWLHMLGWNGIKKGL